jgi:hypothetical protein
MLSRTGTIDVAALASVTASVQVLSSDTGSGPLGGRAAALAAALPARALAGSGHGVSEELVTVATRDFVTVAEASGTTL